MNEDDWLTGTDFAAHVRFGADRLSPRRRRLLAVAFCRAAGDLSQHPDLTDALDVVERFADELVAPAEVERVRQRCRVVAQQAHETYVRTVDAGTGAGNALGAWIRNELAWAVANTASTPFSVEGVGQQAAVAAATARSGIIDVVLRTSPEMSAALLDQHRVLRAVVWEVVGNPFRSPHFVPEWRTDTVRALAQQMYDSRDFNAMPILADALQDAGCDNEGLLAHCREPGEHVRGCWALDLVLGRE